MNTQLTVVLVVVGLAVVYVARQTWRSWRGCGKGCGCATTTPPAALIPPEELKLRR